MLVSGLFIRMSSDENSSLTYGRSRWLPIACGEGSLWEAAAARPQDMAAIAWSQSDEGMKTNRSRIIYAKSRMPRSEAAMSVAISRWTRRILMAGTIVGVGTLTLAGTTGSAKAQANPYCYYNPYYCQYYAAAAYPYGYGYAYPGYPYGYYGGYGGYGYGYPFGVAAGFGGWGGWRGGGWGWHGGFRGGGFHGAGFHGGGFRGGGGFHGHR
jgi:hypothetical protein